MTTSIDSLEEILAELPELVDAEEAKKQSLASEVPLAKKLLKQIVNDINEAIAATANQVRVELSMSNDSPVVSLLIAALRKRHYQVERNSEGPYAKVIFTVKW